MRVVFGAFEAQRAPRGQVRRWTFSHLAVDVFGGTT